MVDIGQVMLRSFMISSVEIHASQNQMQALRREAIGC